MTPRRITIVASELLGRAGTGGAGTADSLLAVALGRHGHQVELLIASGREIGPLSRAWTAIYESAGVDVRVLEPSRGIRPPYLAPPLEVFEALREKPPEVVVVDDWRGLGYASLRARQVRRALTETAFVVYCHGPGRVLTAFAEKVPDTVERFGEQIAERASIELADAVVSPTAWLLGWMRRHGWPVPESGQVIQYVPQSAALDEAPDLAPGGGPMRRLAFFGQLREGKGIRLFLTALEALEPPLLDGVELVFLGSGRGRWTSENILAALAPTVREPLAEIRFETALEREAALAELRRPGTLAVMPSLLDNAPNTVSECIEHGVPFVSTNVGGIPELVAEKDRARVLCEPTATALAARLTSALTSADGATPARPAREPQESVEAWLEVVASVTPTQRRAVRAPTNVAVVARGEASAKRARRLAEASHSAEVEVVLAGSRRAGFDRTTAEWVVFLDEDDNPSDNLLDAFVAAQAASDMDVVTVAVRPANEPDGIQLFLGSPGPLGLLENHYGVLAFIRRDAVATQPMYEDAVDPDWPLLARLALAGCRIVSIPEALSVHSGRRGRAGDVPGEGLAVLEAFEERQVAELHELPQLAATLGAALAKATTAPPDSHVQPLLQRLRRRVALVARASRPS
jgi:glycosyltransferase involved in cell wall biosynthesis